jgi:hypothetical protein
MSSFSNGGTDTFKCVFIPQDNATPCVEKVLPKASLTDDALRQAAEEYFNRDYGAVDKESERRSMGDQLVKQGIEHTKVGQLLDDHASLTAMTAKCEIVAVVVATPDNAYTAVSIYCDGRSSFKPHCKLNERATAIVKVRNPSCPLPPPQPAVN